MLFLVDKKRFVEDASFICHFTRYLYIVKFRMIWFVEITCRI